MDPFCGDLAVTSATVDVVAKFLQRPYKINFFFTIKEDIFVSHQGPELAAFGVLLEKNIRGS